MTINYAPIEDEYIPRRKMEISKKKEESECNTVVMIFIGGVILLALMDTVR
jgi:hypothetical protein